MRKEGAVMYKSQLQEYAQKAGLLSPVYEFTKDGPSHEPRFKAMVCMNGQIYASSHGYLNLRSAEHAAAKVALDSLNQNTQSSGVVPSPVHESGLCKNLLQEYAQKNGYPLPVYHIIRQGEDHYPTFSATVEIGGVNYSGGGAKNKKEAEIKAARTALLAIQSAPNAAAFGLPPIERNQGAVAEVQPGQVATLVKAHPKKKKRGRPNQQMIEEPLATRMKVPAIQAFGTPQVVENLQATQVAQNSQVSQVSYMPQVAPVAQLSPLVDNFQTPQVPHVSQEPQVTQVGHLLQIVGTLGNHQQSSAPLFPVKPESIVTNGTVSVSNGKYQSCTDVTPENRLLTCAAEVQREYQLLKTEVKETLVDVHPTTEHIKPIPMQESPVTAPAITALQVPTATETETIIVTEALETPVVPEVQETPQQPEAHETLVLRMFSRTEEVQQTADLKQDTNEFEVDRCAISIPGITPNPEETLQSDVQQNLVGTQDVIPLANDELQMEILEAMATAAGVQQVVSGA